MLTPMFQALETFMVAQAMADWKSEGGPVYWKAHAVACQTEEEFFSHLHKHLANNQQAPVAKEQE